MGRHAQIKARARKAVHAAFAYRATYKDSTVDTPVIINARWHNKLVLMGDYQDNGYANIIEGIEKVIFDRDEMAAVGITPRQGGVVTIIEPDFGDVILELDQRDPYVGPVEEKWSVARKK